MWSTITLPLSYRHLRDRVTWLIFLRSGCCSRNIWQRRIGYRWYTPLNIRIISRYARDTAPRYRSRLGKLHGARWFTFLSLWYRYSVACDDDDGAGGAPVHFAVHCRWRTISRATIKPKFRGLRSVTPPINRNCNSPLPFNSGRREKRMNRTRELLARAIFECTPFLHKMERALCRAFPWR